MEATKQKVIENFKSKFVDANLWQGEDEYTKNVPIGNIEQFILEVFDTAHSLGEKAMLDKVRDIVENAGENHVGLLDPHSTDSRAFRERFISQDALLQVLSALIPTT